jgi:quinol monooxygenase YgiN
VARTEVTIGALPGYMRSNFVSLHPYFKVHPGKIDEIKALLPRFVEKATTEEACLFYAFSMNGNEFFCREAYENAAELLAHMGNIAGLLAKAMKIADLTRIEVHGPASELDKLKDPLAYLKPAFFALTEPS